MYFGFRRIDYVGWKTIFDVTQDPDPGVTVSGGDWSDLKTSEGTKNSRTETTAVKSLSGDGKGSSTRGRVQGEHLMTKKKKRRSRKL